MVRAAVLAAVSLALAAPAVAQTSLLQPGETLLEVQAQGEAIVTPDTAIVQAGVVSTGTTAAEATAANATRMTAVIAALRKAGVEPRYIRTQQVNVQPRFARSTDDGEERGQITGYVARNSVMITVVKLAIASDVIAAAFAAGANSVDGPEIKLRDDASAQAAARASAIAAAQAQAKAYADGLNMRVVRIIRVSERGQNNEPVYEVVVTGSRLNTPAPAPPVVTPPPVSGGEIRQTATIWVDYALAPRD